MVSLNKRIFASVAAVAALSMGLAGCGSSGSDSNASSDPNEKVEITYMHRLPDNAGMTTVDSIVKQWNKEHPNIHVKATKFNGNASDMIKKLETDVKSGNAPDLAQVGYSELPEVYTKGMLEDVTQYAEQYKSDFASGPFNLMQVGGKYYGLPQDTGPLVYFYNKKAFDDLGISVPKTQSELLDAAKKAAAAGKYIMSFQADEAGNMLTGLAGASGEWYTIKDDAWVVNTMTKGSKSVAKVFQDLLDSKAVATNPRWDPSFDASLQKEQLIGTVGAAWEAPLLMQSIGESGKGNWAVAQLGDWFDNAGKTGPDGGSGVAVLKGCKHSKEAMEFLDWFNTQVDALISQGLVVAANSKDAKTPEEWKTYYDGQDIMQEFIKANENMGQFTYIPGFSAVATAMTDAASKASTGSQSMLSIFEAAQSTSIDTLKDYGLSIAE
ncbi:ABC transporter substrate-binding protein [Bifidobacterium dolichotidis]|uniref:ABC transporter substrate-binding protein n=1 Tax=Bifidobacterium dolichotidis TaxID=2306976 RepID=A0A430FPM6_9BIFI|nr:extracellular solute-binding protein [Bifidobacterium dolichotidis]RSX54792.1 ABC transporter substrate-binding protein [Bifidobacterium dolichotidis]